MIHRIYTLSRTCSQNYWVLVNFHDFFLSYAVVWMYGWVYLYECDAVDLTACVLRYALSFLSIGEPHVEFNEIT